MLQEPIASIDETNNVIYLYGNLSKAYKTNKFELDEDKNNEFMFNSLHALIKEYSILGMRNQFDSADGVHLDHYYENEKEKKSSEFWFEEFVSILVTKKFHKKINNKLAIENRYKSIKGIEERFFDFFESKLKKIGIGDKCTEKFVIGLVVVYWFALLVITIFVVLKIIPNYEAMLEPIVFLVFMHNFIKFIFLQGEILIKPKENINISEFIRAKIYTSAAFSVFLYQASFIHFFGALHAGSSAMLIFFYLLSFISLGVLVYKKLENYFIFKVLSKYFGKKISNSNNRILKISNDYFYKYFGNCNQNEMNAPKTADESFLRAYYFFRHKNVFDKWMGREDNLSEKVIELLQLSNDEYWVIMDRLVSQS